MKPKPTNLSRNYNENGEQNLQQETIKVQEWLKNNRHLQHNLVDTSANVGIKESGRLSSIELDKNNNNIGDKNNKELPHFYLNLDKRSLIKYVTDCAMKDAILILRKLKDHCEVITRKEESQFVYTLGNLVSLYEARGDKNNIKEEDRSLVNKLNYVKNSKAFFNELLKKIPDNKLKSEEVMINKVPDSSKVYSQNNVKINNIPVFRMDLSEYVKKSNQKLGQTNEVPAVEIVISQNAQQSNKLSVKQSNRQEMIYSKILDKGDFVNNGCKPKNQLHQPQMQKFLANYLAQVRS